MRILIFLLVAAAAAADEASPGNAGVGARAEPAVVQLDPLAEDLGYLKLPRLEFALRIEPRCETGGTAHSVLVSVADTRLRHDMSEFDDPTILETTLVVPQPQAGLLRVDGFCRAGGTDRGSRLSIADAFTARLSLRCRTAEQETVAYTTLPLDVVLECRAAQEAPQLNPS